MPREMRLIDLWPCAGRVRQFVRAKDGAVFFYPEGADDDSGFMALRRRSRNRGPARHRRRTRVLANTIIDPNGTQFYPEPDDLPEDWGEGLE